MQKQDFIVLRITEPKIHQQWKPSSKQIWYITGMVLYSEMTWAVGIGQLTHHEVQGGGKNPETGGRRIFAPTADRVVS